MMKESLPKSVAFGSLRLQGGLLVPLVSYKALAWRGMILLSICHVPGTVSVQAENWYDFRNCYKPPLVPEIPPLVIYSFGLNIVLFNLGVRY